MSQDTLTPVAANERITTLDVIRGVALLGIFFMNIEFFNRPIAELGNGLPTDVSGLDYWAGMFVHVFIRAKFWTMFSLLFGMGFAVMLARAEASGRSFLKPYIRRTLALAVIGAAHFIFLWNGDILFSYALGAAFLLIVFHARPKVLMWIAIVALALAAIAGGAALAGFDKVPWAPFLGLGVPVLLLWIVTRVIRKYPLTGLRNAGLALYLLPCLGMMIGGAVTPQVPQAERDAAALAEAKTPAEKTKVREEQAKAAKAVKEQEEKAATERKLLSTGTYAENLAFRAKEFPQNAAQHTFFALFFVLGMFLIGTWFIRSGVMARPAEHLDLYRKLALFGIPLGVGLTIVSAAIATTHHRGLNDGLFIFSQGLMFTAALPACIGYVAAIVLLFHSRFRAWVAPFAPAGRMALTIYLTQSLIGTTVFYGYGLGWWGMGRAAQLVFVVVAFAALLVFAHLWLSRFRYGPMEWLWRAATYLQVPSMRQERLAAA
jgi:uncharacterized membrane protein YeiB